jgi:hypothetical protein
MDVFAGASRLMVMDRAAWARHANPWSVWTRVAILPLLVLAVWSRVWIGWWALLPVSLLAVWTWINPRAFQPPADWDNWASRGVLGEQLWLDRRRIAVPAHHARAARILAALSVLGIVPLAWGLVIFDAGLTLAGTATVTLAKLWFVDRMVWLHQDVTGLRPGTPIPDPQGALA